jgi:hypothetical protein
MEDQPIFDQTQGTIPQEGLPGILGLLTTLTMIGSVLSVLGSLFTTLGCKVLLMEEVTDKMKPNELAFLTATCEHKNILILGAVLGGVLCFAGAVMMRQLKHQGFLVYVVGQILPTLLSVIVMAELMFSDWKSWIGYGIMCFFIGLYATQRKHLVR